MPSNLCGCGRLRARSSRYCYPCKNAAVRRWRRKCGGYRGLTEEQRRKDISRSYAGVWKRRGLLVPQPCQNCGRPDVVMHHEDYDKPTQVEWLCEECHRTLHKCET